VEIWLQRPFQIIKRIERSTCESIVPAGFVDAVSRARHDSLDEVVTTVKAFAGEPEVLYVALDYAHHFGMPVIMAPPTEGHKVGGRP
jgi:hypothetical protein